MKKYSVTTPKELRSLCIRKDWFTCGTTEQYDKLFYANENGGTLKEIATIIWVCSNDVSPREILEELTAVKDEYLIDIEFEKAERGVFPFDPSFFKTCMKMVVI